jgi:hypothetical protein
MNELIKQHPGNDAQTSVVASTSKLNHCPGVFNVRKGRDCQICDFWTYVGPKTEYVCKNLHQCPKTHRKQGRKVSCWKHIKMNHLPSVFIIRKGRYCQGCVGGHFLGKN